MFSEEDLQNVMRMVLPENKGNVLTEAMMLGIEASILHYLKNISADKVSAEDIPVIDEPFTAGVRDGHQA